MKSFNARLEEYRAIIEKSLDMFFPAHECLQSKVFEAARYSLLSGGKRLRPALLLEFFSLCGGEITHALPTACAVEMIHTYSLIHDDLPCMDDDDMRRGRSSCHKAYGEAAALLAGDALLNRAFEVMTVSPGVPAKRVLKAAAYISRQTGVFGMIGGQMIDMSVSSDSAIQRATHSTRVDLKTAALFRAACVGGCLLAGASPDRTSAAEEFATAFGVAFQLVDDYLDVYGDSDSFGKPVGSDEKNAKSTFISILGKDELKSALTSMLSHAGNALTFFPDSKFLNSLLEWSALRTS